jgi:restriction system protein
VSIPDFQTLILPVLRIAAEGEVRVSDVVERLALEFGSSPEERSHLLPSGTKTTFSNRVHWAKSHLGKAGLVELTKRAHFRITDQGREALAASPERIDIKYLNRFPSYQQFRGTAELGEETVSVTLPAAEMAEVLTPDEVMRNANRQMEIALADELMQRIQAGTPGFFKSLVVRLLVGMGCGGSVADLSRLWMKTSSNRAV